MARNPDNFVGGGIGDFFDQSCNQSWLRIGGVQRGGIRGGQVETTRLEGKVQASDGHDIARGRTRAQKALGRNK